MHFNFVFENNLLIFDSNEVCITNILQPYNRIIVRFGSVRFEIFKTEMTEPTELLYMMNLVRIAPVYFLINCLNTSVYFLISRFIS